MIPPSLLNVTYYFSLLPVWEQQPVEPASCPPPASAAEGSDGTPSETNAQPNGQPTGDADGINDQVAMRMVLKGYKLTAIPQWEAEANLGYERWTEDRGDDDVERQRQDQRTRSAARPTSSQAPTDAGTDPVAPSEGE